MHNFSWHFLAVPVSNPDSRPIALFTTAQSEAHARENCPGWLLFLVARLPVQEVSYA